MRRSNRSVILTRIFRDGPLSRQELGRETALSAASVSNLVGETRVRVELFDLSMRQVAKAEYPIEAAAVEPTVVVREVLRGLDE